MSDTALEALGQSIVANSAGAIVAFKVAFGELTLTAQAPRIVEALSQLRDHPDTRFQQMIDLTCVDYPERAQRFDVVYHLLSMVKNHRIRVKIATDEDTPVATVTSVYPVADWYEREAFDMYGVFFDGHPDLRRILTDYGFHGHPLRKDFPMTGYVEVRYDDELKRVVYEPVKIAEFRQFDFLSPWEGAQYALPGDEKAKDQAKGEGRQ
ncbi:MAG: NADH-quinone oxidoreductase subunit C [Caulobacter sp.]|jgi:NADH-quinone oxidoreductase subunit C